MKQTKRLLVLLFVAWFAFNGLNVSQLQTFAAPNDYVSITKNVNPTAITTLEEAEVTLNITGTPPANVIMPNDVVLIIDKSGSMHPDYNNGEDKMGNAKEAAKGFVDLMDLSTHRVAVVDFSASNNIGTMDFTTNKSTAKSYIDTIQAAGGTATGDAIDTAISILANHRPEAQPVIVIMTDGDATQPSGNPYNYAKQKADLAKEEGIVFYTIALLNATDNPDTSGPNVLLKEMATTANHHHFVLGSTGLSQIYAAIVKEIGLASAYDVVVSDIVGENFEIVPGSYDANIPKPQVSGNTLTWTFKELKNSTLSFKYKVRPVASSKTGRLPVALTTSNVAYKDYAGASRSKLIPLAYINVKLPAPVVTTITESAGHPVGGETVTITGEHFVANATVRFGSTQATNVNVISGNVITATVPAGSQGTVDVIVRNPDGQTAQTQYQYVVDPTITSITPANGPLVGGTVVTINGTYFMRGLTVSFGENPGVLVTYTNSSEIRVRVPAGAEAGPVDVKIVNPDSTETSLSEGYSYDLPPSTDPEILNVTPNSGLITGGNTIYVDGKNFKTGMKVVIGDKDAQAAYVNTTRYRVTVPAGDAPGTVDVAIKDLEDRLFVKEQAYTYTAIVYPQPELNSITPNNGLTDGGGIAYLDGKNFVNNVSKVIFDSQEISYVYMSSSRLRITIPAAANPGKVNVKVVTDDKEAELVEAYEYIAPVIPEVKITSITPNTGLVTGGYIVFIDGENFSGGASVTIGDKSISGIYVNSGRLRITVPAVDAPGLVDITVTNRDGGTATVENGFEYTPVLPTISGVTPGNANRVGGATIYVDGSGFNNTATVTINGVTATTAYVSNSRLRVTVPASSVVGEVPLVVMLSNGLSVSITFIYDNGPVVPAPTIASLTSTSGVAGQTIYIDGSDFKNKPRVFFGAVEATSVTYTSTKRIRVTVPAGNSGPVDVKVINPDEQESNTVTYTYN